MEISAGPREQDYTTDALLGGFFMIFELTIFKSIIKPLLPYPDSPENGNRKGETEK